MVCAHKIVKDDRGRSPLKHITIDFPLSLPVLGVVLGHHVFRSYLPPHISRPAHPEQ